MRYFLLVCATFASLFSTAQSIPLRNPTPWTEFTRYLSIGQRFGLPQDTLSQPSGASVRVTNGLLGVKNGGVYYLYNGSWIPVGAGSGVPVGGATGQALIKNSGTNFDAGWSTISNSLVGTGYQVGIAGGRNLKAVVRGYGGKIDSNATTLTISADTNQVTSRLDRDKLKDTLVSVFLTTTQTFELLRIGDSINFAIDGDIFPGVYAPIGSGGSYTGVVANYFANTGGGAKVLYLTNPGDSTMKARSLTSGGGVLVSENPTFIHHSIDTNIITTRWRLADQTAKAANQIIYGTGTGLTSSPNFTYNGNSLALNLVGGASTIIGDGLSGFEVNMANGIDYSGMGAGGGEAYLTIDNSTSGKQGKIYAGFVAGAKTAGVLYAEKIVFTGRIRHTAISSPPSTSFAVTDAHGSFIRLPSIFANQTMTLPDGDAFKEIINVFNSNTSPTYLWSVSGNVVDAAGIPITTLANGTLYQFYWDAVNWVAMDVSAPARDLTLTSVIDPGSISAGTFLHIDITVSGASTGDPVVVGFSGNIDNLIHTEQVRASNTVRVSFYNPTGSPIDPPSQTFRIKVMKL